MKTNLILCDACKDKVGRIKCNLCKKDLCIDCISNVDLVIRTRRGQNNIGAVAISFCEECSLELMKGYDQNHNFFDSGIMGRLKKEIVDYTNKTLILDALEEDKK